VSGHFAISKPFAMFLAVTGALAAIAVAAPTLVMIGFFYRILPGIVLFVAPSVFLYAFAWYLARTGILIAGTVARFDSGRWWFKVLAGVTAIPIRRSRHATTHLVSTDSRSFAPAVQRQATCL